MYLARNIELQIIISILRIHYELQKLSIRNSLYNLC